MPKKDILSEVDMRRRLGLADIEKKKQPPQALDLGKQLEDEEKTRDDFASDVLHLIETLKENSLGVQKSLQNDASQIQNIDDLLAKNRDEVNTEISRLSSIYQSTAMGCRTHCAMISTVLMIWIGVYILLKITPSPS